MDGQTPVQADDITRILREARGEGRDAIDRLLPLVYEPLRRVAFRQLRREREGHTLDPTALVHEAYLKLLPAGVEWRDRAHFFAVAARAMRQVLVDHARVRAAEKRGGNAVPTTLSGKDFPVGLDFEELLALDDALGRLDERQRRVVEMRFFAGMTEEEIAEVLGLSVRTVQREWVKARAWLYAELYPGQ